MATISMSAETEPLIGTKHHYRRVLREQPPLSKAIRPYRVKPILCLIALLVVTALIILAISPSSNHHDAKPNVNWVRMEEAHRHKNHVPSPWSLKEECDDDHIFTIALALKQQNVEKLDAHIYEVSDPKSDTFHQYWTTEQVRSYFAPSDETLQAVLDWLETNGFTQDNDKVKLMGPYGNIIKVSVTCSEANALLNTNYMFYENKQQKATHLRVKNGDYSIPDTVFTHIDFITPTIRFPLRQHTLKMELMSAKAPKGDKKPREAQEIYNSPARLFDLYQMTASVSNIMDNTDVDASTCRQSVLSLIGEFFDDSDLTAFWREFEVYPESEMERVPSTQPEGYGSEAELDTQYITGIGRGIFTYVYYMDDEVDPFIGITEAIFDTDTPPLVVSISYGAEEYSLGEEYARRSSEELGKLALIGTTVLVSSGDAGVLGDDSDCYNGDTFAADFPASSPYVTAVGGTENGKVPEDNEDGTGEIAWVNSGGGFSGYFDAPSWQKKAVKAYFDQEDVAFPVSSRYNAAGRGYPDISAQAVDYAVAIKGEFYLVSGTSASSPTVAGMISMINYARIQNDKSPLGFLNPVLYKQVYLKQNGDYDYYFNDIVSGYNLGCKVDDDIGFYTAEGWDPITGCGTPKFHRLYEALMKIK